MREIGEEEEDEEEEQVPWVSLVDLTEHRFHQRHFSHHKKKKEGGGDNLTYPASRQRVSKQALCHMFDLSFPSSCRKTFLQAEHRT